MNKTYLIRKNDYYMSSLEPLEWRGRKEQYGRVGSIVRNSILKKLKSLLFL